MYVPECLVPQPCVTLFLARTTKLQAITLSGWLVQYYCARTSNIHSERYGGSASDAGQVSWEVGSAHNSVSGLLSQCKNHYLRGPGQTAAAPASRTSISPKTRLQLERALEQSEMKEEIKHSSSSTCGALVAISNVPLQVLEAIMEGERLLKMKKMNGTDPGLCFYRFPHSDSERCAKWVTAVRRWIVCENEKWGKK